MKRNAIVLLFLALVAGAVNSARGQSARSEARKTPLGTQRPMPEAAALSTKAPRQTQRPSEPTRPVVPREAPATIVQRARSVHGNGEAAGGVKDSIAEGRITYFRGTGSESRQVTFDMTLLRKGETQVQRTVKQTAGEVRQGSNGSRTWNSFKGDAHRAAGASLAFIESQTTRALDNLLDYNRRNGVLRDAGTKDNEQVVEVQDRGGRKTQYFIDSGTARVTQIEFEVGQARDMLSGKPVPIVESYRFSDFREVQGSLTPFRIERYAQGTKLEEMQFSTVRHNSSVPDSAFHP